MYPQGPFDKDGTKALAELFKGVCGKQGANVIYDAVGGDYAEASLRAIAWEGRFLVVGFPAGIPKIPLNLALLKGCQIVGSTRSSHLSELRIRPPLRGTRTV